MSVLIYYYKITDTHQLANLLRGFSCACRGYSPIKRGAFYCRYSSTRNRFPCLQDVVQFGVIRDGSNFPTNEVGGVRGGRRPTCCRRGGVGSGVVSAGADHNKHGPDL